MYPVEHPNAIKTSADVVALASTVSTPLDLLPAAYQLMDRLDTTPGHGFFTRVSEFRDQVLAKDIMPAGALFSEKLIEAYTMKFGDIRGLHRSEFIGVVEAPAGTSPAASLNDIPRVSSVFSKAAREMVSLLGMKMLDVTENKDQPAMDFTGLPTPRSEDPSAESTSQGKGAKLR